MKRRMIDQAIILAGGLGTRLRPFTDHTPKPLLPVKGKPIVQYAIENLKKYGVKNIILSTGYKAEQFPERFRDGKKFGVDLKYVYEEQALGTGGAVQFASRELNKPFFLLWGDNLMDIDLNAMYKAYLHDAPQITMALTPRIDVENFGVAKLEGNKIVSFVEKPKREEAPSNYINAGAFIIDPKCLKILPEGKSSIERDCFEKLASLGEISAFIHEGQWYPTDTVEKYSLACSEFISDIDLSKKKVIIADVDNTICESCQQISPRMSEQINGLLKKGYHFAFISGTKVEDLLQMISPQLTEEHHLLGNTGTKYVKVKNGASEMLYAHLFTPLEKAEICAAFEKLIAHFGIVPMTTREDQLQDRESQITLSALGRHAPSEIKKNFDTEGEKRKTWVEFLRKYLSEEKYDIRIGGTSSIDVTRKGLDKEWGIKEFVQHHGFDFNEILFIGDKLYPGGNDYPAAKIVDCISVRNPEDTLKELRKLG